MKKYILGAVFTLGIVLSPAFTQATGLSNAQVQAIILLLSSFGADSATIANVNVALTGGTPTTGTQTFCYNFKNDLTVGSSGADVSALNQALTLSGVNTTDNTSFFNENNAADVVSFQAKYGIRQTGYVGPLTRTKLNGLYGCANTQQPAILPTTPTQYSFTASPSTGTAPLAVTLINIPEAVSTKVSSCIYSQGFFGSSGNGLSVEWGDGTYSPAYSASKSGQSCAFDVRNHTYASPGTYTIRLKSWHPGPTDAPVIDWQGTTTVTVTGTSPTAPTLTFTASPTTITAGQSATLSWSNNSNSYCEFLGGKVNNSGSLSITPYSTTQYSVTCYNLDGTSLTKSVTVNVTQQVAPTLTLTANPATVAVGQSSTLSWASQNATSCSFLRNSNPSTQPVPTSGSLIGNPQSTDTYTFTCVGSGLSVSKSVTISVTDNNTSSSCTISSNKMNVSVNEPFVITWNTTNMISPVMYEQRPGGGHMEVGANGSRTFSFSESSGGGETATFQISGGGLNAPYNPKCSVTVNVQQPTQPAPTANAGLNRDIALPINTVTPLNQSASNPEGTVVTYAWTNIERTSGSAAPVITNGTTLTPTFSSLTAGSYTFRLTVTDNNRGLITTDDMTVTVSAPPTAPTLIFTANPTTVASGQPTTLSWSSTNATSCAYVGGGPLTLSGSDTTGPTYQTKTISITCTGLGGSITKSVIVTVPAPAPTLTFSANKTVIASGQSATLTWSAANVNSNSCMASGSPSFTGTQGSSGSISTGPLTSSKTYTFVCPGPGGSVTKSVTITVTSLTSVVGVGVNQGTYPSGIGPTTTPQPEGIVNVKVTGASVTSPTSAILLLTAYEPVNWIVDTTAGSANILKVITIGYYNQRVTGLASSIPVEYYSFVNDGFYQFAYQTGDEYYLSLKNWLAGKGLTIKSFTGSYNGSSLQVNVSS